MLLAKGKPMTMGSMLAQEDENGVKMAIYYLSRVLNDTKTRYSEIEKNVFMIVFLLYKIKILYKVHLLSFRHYRIYVV